MKKKICFLIQRYGLEVNGGAELLCRQFAELLNDVYDVHVYTSKAIDYMTWRDYYPNELEQLNGVTIHRFSVKKERKQEEFETGNEILFGDRVNNLEKRATIEKYYELSKKIILVQVVISIVSMVVLTIIN